MKANIFKKCQIIWGILYSCAWLTILVFYHDFLRGGYTREYADTWLRWWGKKNVEAFRTNLTINYPRDFKIEPGRPYIIMSNHRSHFDIPVSMLVMPGSVRMLAKSELFKIPLWGRGLRHGEFISIDRSHPMQAKRDLAAAREKMESGILVWIYPEGGRSRTGELKPFKKGGFIIAIDSGATIIPVGLQGTREVVKPETLDFYLDRDVTVNVGEPINTSSYSQKEKDRLIEVVHSEIAKLAGEA
ncbi:MAG: 1-acyl-sn-glycerol-3-phosphate acyltransferase [Actinobacteria bacterium]|nr:1-acyl-sn-glycerol-3-phosphate acyltransferase [Actinomycetota bacterium]